MRTFAKCRHSLKRVHSDYIVATICKASQSIVILGIHTRTFDLLAVRRFPWLTVPSFRQDAKESLTNHHPSHSHPRLWRSK